MQLFCRRSEPLRITPGRPRQFQLSLVAPDPRIYSVEQVTRIVTWAEDRSMSINVGNVGTAYTPVIIRLTGPIVAPMVILTNEGEALSFERQSFTVPAGATLVLDTAKKTAVMSGQNQYHNLVFEQSTWWSLPPQSSSLVRVRGEQQTAATTLRVEYRHAWM
jgi:hypothetical protein